jgi:CheY-like chemotaxis protein
MEKKNILLVDDDSIANFLIEKIIQSTGLARNIFKALNGKEALEYFDQNNELPEVVLLDLNMPVMNGFEFLRAFQVLDVKDKDDVLIIMVTSSGNPSDKEQARSLGVRHYLTKPISAEMIRSIIHGEFSGASTDN